MPDTCRQHHQHARLVELDERPLLESELAQVQCGHALKVLDLGGQACRGHRRSRDGNDELPSRKQHSALATPPRRKVACLALVQAHLRLDRIYLRQIGRERLRLEQVTRRVLWGGLESTSGQLLHPSDVGPALQGVRRLRLAALLEGWGHDCPTGLDGRDATKLLREGGVLQQHDLQAVLRILDVLGEALGRHDILRHHIQALVLVLVLLRFCGRR